MSRDSNPSNSADTHAAPAHWAKPCVHSECTLHQLAPYIGKLKSSIAGDLVARYAGKDDLVVDPFAGAGTVPLEAARLGRPTFSADRSPYAIVLTKGKLHAPPTVEEACRQAKEAILLASSMPEPDLQCVPAWVQQFFHPKTLIECLRFSEVCKRHGQSFLLGCFLGILHHQRPGFLSYPSSHLVPYLRSKNFPREDFPGMYEYRPLEPRLMAKIRRMYRRVPAGIAPRENTVVQSDVQNLVFPEQFGLLVTSPPYMNALDYVRDNRLRMWFLDPSLIVNATQFEKSAHQRENFHTAIECVARAAEMGLTKGGHCVLVVGEKVRRREATSHPADSTVDILRDYAPSLQLIERITDSIPDVRRSRRGKSGTKTEAILVFRKVT